MPAQAANRVEHHGPLQVDREPSPFAAIEDHINHGQAFVVQLECRPVALAKLDPVFVDRHGGATNPNASSGAVALCNQERPLTTGSGKWM